MDGTGDRRRKVIGDFAITKNNDPRRLSEEEEMSSSNSPCAACKMQRRKCTQDCVFAPYFPPDQPQKFSTVHRVFGASNVSKLLSELATAQREDAVNSLAYEAEARLRDPVYGCVGLISILQQTLKQVQSDLNSARTELAAYIGPTALLPIFPPQPTPDHILRRPAPLPPIRSYLPQQQQQQQHQHQHQHQQQQPMNPGLVLNPNTPQYYQHQHQFQQQHLAQTLIEHHLQEQQQMLMEEQQYAAAAMAAAAAAEREQEELLRMSLEQKLLHQQQQQLETQDFISVNSGANTGGFDLGGVTGTSNVVDLSSPILALGNGSFDSETQPQQLDQHQHHQYQFLQQQQHNHHHQHHHHHHHQHYEIQEQLMLQTPQPQAQQQYQLGFLRKLDGDDHHGKSLDPSL